MLPLYKAPTPALQVHSIPNSALLGFVCEFVVMLSQQPSPVPLRLPSPAPPHLPSAAPPQLPLPEPAQAKLPPPQSDSSDYSSESDDYVTPVKKQKVNEEESDSSDYSSESDDNVTSVKKQKLNEESEQKLNEESDLEDGESSKLEPLTVTDDEIYLEDSDEEELSIKDRSLCQRYFQQVRESEGFDIKDYPGALPWTTIFPMPDHLKYPANVTRLKGYASEALKQYNEKHGTKYEVDEILKVNGDDMEYLYFYITLSVKNGEYHYFQVKAVERINKPLRFPIVRPRVKGGLDI